MADIKVSPVRTGLCAQIGRFIVTWGGIGYGEADHPVLAINIDTLRVHAPDAIDGEIPSRSGMLVIPLTVPATASGKASQNSSMGTPTDRGGADSPEDRAHLGGSTAICRSMRVELEERR